MSNSLERLFKYPYNLLIIFVALGLILRAINTSSNPPSLYGDELTLVYDAYSLIKIGTDQTGKPYPLTFEMGESRPASYVYFSIPFVALFGSNELGARSLSILSGIGIIILIFFLGRRLSNNSVGLGAAFLMTISPWGISLSRGGFESHFGLFLTLLGFLLFLKGELKSYIFSALCFGLAIHSYSAFKLTIPLIVLTLLWYERKLLLFQKNKKLPLAIFCIILSIFGGILFWESKYSNAQGRFSRINVFSLDNVKDEINKKIYEQRELSALPESFRPLFHNEKLEYFYLIGESYLKSFSLDFLFLHGDKNPRHNMANLGGLYLFEIITVILGFIFFWKYKRRELGLLSLWIFIGALPNSLFLDPHAIRGSLMLIPLIVLSGSGLVLLTTSLQSKKRMIFFFLFLGILVLNVAIFLNFQYFTSPKIFSRFWSHPAKQAVAIANDKRSEYDKVIISDRIESVEHAFYVYNQIDPKKVLEQKKSPILINGYNFKQFGNIYIGQFPLGAVDKIFNEMEGSVFYIGDYSESKEVGYHYIESGLDRKRAFIVLHKK